MYLEQNAIPGGTKRNWNSYSHKVAGIEKNDWTIQADPQTSGGLLVSIDSEKESEFENVCLQEGVNIKPIRNVTKLPEQVVYVK